MVYLGKFISYDINWIENTVYWIHNEYPSLDCFKSDGECYESIHELHYYIYELILNSYMDINKKKIFWNLTFCFSLFRVGALDSVKCQK